MLLGSVYIIVVSIVLYLALVKYVDGENINFIVAGVIAFLLPTIMNMFILYLFTQKIYSSFGEFLSLNYINPMVLVAMSVQIITIFVGMFIATRNLQIFQLYFASIFLAVLAYIVEPYFIH